MKRTLGKFLNYLCQLPDLRLDSGKNGFTDVCRKVLWQFFRNLIDYLAGCRRHHAKRRIKIRTHGVSFGGFAPVAALNSVEVVPLQAAA
jgi:hypothetical protein